VRKKKPFLVGITVGLLVRPVIVRVYRPFHGKVREKIYNLALDYIQNFDADRPS